MSSDNESDSSEDVQLSEKAPRIPWDNAEDIQLSEKAPRIPWENVKVKQLVLGQVFFSKPHLAKHGDTDKSWKKVTKDILAHKLLSKFKKVGSKHMQNKFGEYIAEVRKKAGIDNASNTSGLEQPAEWEKNALYIIRELDLKGKEAHDLKDADVRRSQSLVARENEVLSNNASATPIARPDSTTSNSSSDSAPATVYKRQRLVGGDPFMDAMKLYFETEKEKTQIEKEKLEFEKTKFAYLSNRQGSTY